ncbi:unnamed protein product [Euphydryas editha]|uniref:Uncharacterized protein n=1 Tax=Euphydryas editha TaxID=104508 RepID=A0AAU9UNW3_EUPED|nr:unnamed protein product [Euphydryas editha]
MVLVLRTPIKRMETSNPPSTPTKNVKKIPRQSLEKWEGAAPESAYTAEQGAPTTSKQKTPTPKRVDSSKEGKGARVCSPVATAERTRVQQATALLNKARLSISSYRNLKTKIKNSILKSMAGLKKLVADSETDSLVGSLAERARKEGRGPVRVEPVANDTDITFTVPPDSGLSASLDEHSWLLLESNERIKALQE